MLDLSNKNKLYYSFKIKKPNGKFREICAPCLALKLEQKKLANRLSKLSVSDHCFGFRRGLSTRHAAEMHVGKRWIITIDIENFFPSIKKDMLWFLSDYEKDLATLNDCLVQGAPSSPVISNIFLRSIDKRFVKYFSSLNINYSRYADDICLSSNDPLDKKHIKFIDSVLLTKGLRINKKKIRIMFKDDRQSVLGINVNSCLSINREIRRKLRASIHQGKEDEKTRGMLSYIRSINRSQFNHLTT